MSQIHTLGCHWSLMPEIAVLKNMPLQVEQSDGCSSPLLGHVAFPVPIEKGLNVVLSSFLCPAWLFSLPLEKYWELQKASTWCLCPVLCA